MYRAENFIRKCPLLKEGGVVNRLNKAKALNPFNAKKVAKLGCSSSEKACLNFALTLYNPGDYPFEIGKLLINVSDQATLDHVAEWIRKGSLALD